MTRVSLVFRTIGERTSELALELAREHIQPDEVYVLENYRPFTETVQRMLSIDFDSEYVVSVDADSLICEDMRPWLDKNREPYVDCYVFDRFRGRIHCGVHITRIDVIRAMRDIAPPSQDEAYVLRPESRLRKLALNVLGYQKCYKGFRIFHDYFQWLRDIWAKYALRELRSRTREQRRRLDAAIERWKDAPDDELRVAAAAVRWAQHALPHGTPAAELAAAIDRLAEESRRAVAELGIEERGPLARHEAMELAARFDSSWPTPIHRPRVFGIGLSRTGTRSLTAALHVLGIDTVHYPIDADTFRALKSGALDFGLLEYYDGITDITVAPYYAQLERRYPDAKFILTLREPTSWLRSCQNHWIGRDAFEPARSPGAESHMHIRRFLRAAVFGAYDFSPERFLYVYEKHVAEVRRYFSDKPGKLLELEFASGERVPPPEDIVAGQGWDELCTFLGRPLPTQPFPHKGAELSKRLAEAEDPDD